MSQKAHNPRSLWVTLSLVLVGLVLFSGFSALGIWQVKRLAWKEALIERIDSRVNATPIEAPGREQWPQINVADHEYLRVTLNGQFLQNHITFVNASTKLGMGYWVMAPLQLADDSIVLINRGFVSTEQRNELAKEALVPSDPVSVTGLLRLNEPEGTTLRNNQPEQDRWYSRDVVAIAEQQGLQDVAPYFVDQEASSSEPPVGGLTVITFRNNHLVYAVTWFCLAFGVLVAGLLVWKFH